MVATLPAMTLARTVAPVVAVPSRRPWEELALLARATEEAPARMQRELSVAQVAAEPAQSARTEPALAAATERTAYPLQSLALQSPTQVAEVAVLSARLLERAVRVEAAMAASQDWARPAQPTRAAEVAATVLTTETPEAQAALAWSSSATRRASAAMERAAPSHTLAATPSTPSRAAGRSPRLRHTPRPPLQRSLRPTRLLRASRRLGRIQAQ